MTTANQHTARHQKAVDALRIPYTSLRAVPNTVRQSLADVIEEQQRQIDRYGLALMMIREGCTDPAVVAAAALSVGKDV